jgi:hypothetical protein
MAGAIWDELVCLFIGFINLFYVYIKEASNP